MEKKCFEAGDKASDFTLYNHNEKAFKLSDFKGKRILLSFHPLAWTGVCAKQMKSLENNFKEFEELIVEHEAPAVISSNMATGVNIFFKMISILTAYLEEWDIEVIEAHHHRKVDAPSGTALTIGKIIAETIGANFDQVAKFGRSFGPNKRIVGAKNEIGFHSIRAGDIVGDHTVLYAGPGERIEFKHQIHSRMCLASGAITAIKFIAEARENKIYTTREVLGL